MKTAYLDCSSGISGDMCLGALVDAGAGINKIKAELNKLRLDGYSISAKKVKRNGITATKVDVKISKAHDHHHQHHHSRKWKDINKLITTSGLSPAIKKKGLAIFESLFAAEAKVHGEPIDHVHLHELGAVDCMVDIFGTLIGLDLLGVDKVIVSNVNTGQGTVRTAHGMLPVPAPATAELLKGLTTYSSGINMELTTPTGASIIKEVAFSQGPLQMMSVKQIGYGAGSKEIPGMPNVLRIMIGEEALARVSNDEVVVMETNIDDMNPQYYETVIDRLFAAGALDVFLENIIMKKGRPAIKLTVISGEKNLSGLSDVLFSQTTTIGIRFHKAERQVLKRESVRVKTSYGTVRYKISRHNGKIVTATPEYADLKIIAENINRPIKEIAAGLPAANKLLIIKK
jgi:pyridinium-3,5-bisthiocarboxylic acid mononucleotide nickel chelatase